MLVDPVEEVDELSELRLVMRSLDLDTHGRPLTARLLSYPARRHQRVE
jgi:hypothetical protein